MYTLEGVGIDSLGHVVWSGVGNVCASGTEWLIAADGRIGESLVFQLSVEFAGHQDDVCR